MLAAEIAVEAVAAPAVAVAAPADTAGLSVSQAAAPAEVGGQRRRGGVVDAAAGVGEEAGAVVKLHRLLVMRTRNHRGAGPLIKVLAGGERVEVGAKAKVGGVMEGGGAGRMACLQTKSEG